MLKILGCYRIYLTLIPLLILVAYLLNDQPGSKQNYEWKNLTHNAAFTARDTAHPFIFDEKMYLSNGYNNAQKLSKDLWVSTNGIDWSLIDEDTPYDGYSSIIEFKGNLLAIKNSVWKSTDARSWKLALQTTPFGQDNFGSLNIFNDAIWFFGRYGDIWNSADGVMWDLVTDNAAFGQREGAGIITFNNKLWLFGGLTRRVIQPPEKGYKEFETFNDVWVSEDGKIWKKALDHAPWQERIWFGLAEFDERLWLFGGYDNKNNQNFEDVWSTSNGSDWEIVTPQAPFGRRHWPSLFVFKDSIFLVAGNAWPLKNDVWRLEKCLAITQIWQTKKIGQQNLCVPFRTFLMKIKGLGLFIFESFRNKVTLLVDEFT